MACAKHKKTYQTVTVKEATQLGRDGKVETVQDDPLRQLCLPPAPERGHDERVHLHAPAGLLVQPFQPCQNGVLSSPAVTRAFFSALGRTSVSASWSSGSQ